MSEAITTVKKPTMVFTGKSVVLVANELNISIFKPNWFTQLDILKPEDLNGQVVFTPVLVQIPAPAFSLVLVPNRLQITFGSLDPQESQEPLDRVLGGILRALPHTPMTALGMNCDFFISPSAEEPFAKWNADNFGAPVMLKTFGAEEGSPRFGSYSSMNVEGFRLKLETKPLKREGVQAPPHILSALSNAPEWMHLAFNYHCDLNQDSPAAHALELLTKWNPVVSHAQSVLNQVIS